MQADVLHRGPNNGQTTGFRGEHINLIGALLHIAEQTLNRIRGLNMPMHVLRKLVKGEGLLFILSETAHRFGIAFAIFGGSRPPVGSMPPVYWADPRCRRVRLAPRHALVAGWPQTVPRQQRAVLHAHR